MQSSIQEFLESQYSLVDSTKRNYLFAVKRFEEVAKKPFPQVYMDKKIVHKVLGVLSETIAPSTWNLNLTLYKRLARWFNDPEDDLVPKFWRKIKPKSIDWENKLKDKWLTEEEFYKLLDVVDYPRDKAMYGVAVEGALRAGELLGLKIRDVQKTSYGYDVTVSGKTGSSSFPVVLFAPLLTQWLNLHPYKHDPEAPLWSRRVYGRWGSRYNGVKQSSAFENIRKYAKMAGLRPISLHWLRHTKITWTAKNSDIRVSDEMAKKMFRWKKSSRMYSHYTHLHGTDTKDTMLALAGVEPKKMKEKSLEVLKPRKCLNCQELNSVESLYCHRCGFVLNEKEARNILAQKKMEAKFMNSFKSRDELESFLSSVKSASVIRFPEHKLRLVLEKLEGGEDKRAMITEVFHGVWKKLSEQTLDLVLKHLEKEENR